jgi:hypothetical protein
MKNFFCALLLMTAVFGGGKVFAQYSNKVWCFGDSADYFYQPVSLNQALHLYVQVVLQ